PRKRTTGSAGARQPLRLRTRAPPHTPAERPDARTLSASTGIGRLSLSEGVDTLRSQPVRRTNTRTDGVAMHIRSVTVENVKSFRGKHHFELRPGVNYFVGDNN